MTTTITQRLYRILVVQLRQHFVSGDKEGPLDGKRHAESDHLYVENRHPRNMRPTKNSRNFVILEQRFNDK